MHRNPTHGRLFLYIYFFLYLIFSFPHSTVLSRTLFHARLFIFSYLAPTATRILHSPDSRSFFARVLCNITSFETKFHYSYSKVSCCYPRNHNIFLRRSRRQSSQLIDISSPVRFLLVLQFLSATNIEVSSIS